jgi:hypothetical protein
MVSKLCILLINPKTLEIPGGGLILSGLKLVTMHNSVLYIMAVLSQSMFDNTWAGQSGLKRLVNII